MGVKKWQLDPGQLGPGAQLSTFWGRTVGPRGPSVHFSRVDNRAPDSWALWQKPSNWHIFPKCCQLLSNMSIYNIELLIYIIYQQIYVTKTCARRAYRKPSICFKLPKCWQLIYNTNIYYKTYIHQLKGSTETLQLAYTLTYPNCWLDICNTNNICFFMFTIYYLYSIWGIHLSWIHNLVLYTDYEMYIL